MENRFGLKDLLILLLLVGVLVSVWLMMKQNDRQWKVSQEIVAGMDRQTQELSNLRRAIQRGITVNTTTTQAAETDPAESDHGNLHVRLEQLQQRPDYAAGDWHIDMFAQTVGKLTPHLSSDVYASVVQNYVLESLAERNPYTLEWVPLIARSWDISEDGLTITFELREDVEFSDGQLLTSEDVVYSFEMIKNPRIDAPRSRAYFEKVESVTADGPHRVTFQLSDPYYLGFSIVAGMDILPRHYYEQFTEEEFNASTGLLMGSGPYRLGVDPELWRPGMGEIELVRNNNYWGPAAAFNRIIWRETTDATARLTSFRNGEVDRYSPTPEQYLNLKDDPIVNDLAELYEFESITSGYRYVGWNQRRDGQPTKFADVRVRKAMTLLTDRQEMADRLMVGLATVAVGPFHPLGNQADPDIEPWPYDPDAAKALLKEAGWEDRNGDGVIQNEAGEPFVFRLIYPSGNVNYQQMALYLKDSYARAGIVLDLDPLEWTIMIQRMNERNFDAITLGWGGTIESDPYQIFHSNQIEAGGDNYVSYRNPELDALIEEARTTIDEDDRMALWRQVHAILHEDQPYTFLFNQRSVVFIDRRIENVRRTKVGISSPVEWFVPTAQQKRAR